MLAAQRRARILSELSRDGTVRVTDLVELLDVSDMTVRRDLVALHREGLLEKVHGGALAGAEPSASEPGFAAKSVQRRREKDAIAAAAAALVHPGMAIAVSAGTTTHALTGHLAHIPDLTVVTNSVWVADVLHRIGEPTTSVLLTGGLRTPSDALVGPVAVSSLRSLHVDAFFMGVHGMDVRAGFSTPNLLESETNRAMIERSRRLIVCADSSKWGVVGLSSMAQLSEAAVLVTDSGLAAHASGALTDHVGELVVVDPVDDADDAAVEAGHAREDA
ncbi:MAG TPA: DeoR/GlpR family DNA-binding transcription regulator [Nocardioides sp.]|nr:DeoR/GlpR family DNA-binding transcription regulator [Nocardioides sp.]